MPPASASSDAKDATWQLAAESLYALTQADIDDDAVLNGRAAKPPPPDGARLVVVACCVLLEVAPDDEDDDTERRAPAGERNSATAANANAARWLAAFERDVLSKGIDHLCARLEARDD